MTAPRGATSPRWVRATFRTQLWWSPKVLPALGTALLAALLAEADPGPSLTRLAALLVSAAGIAAGSHLVNDWADIEADALAGKPNLAASMAVPARAVLLVAAVAIGIGPWLLVGLGAPATVLLGVLLVLPVVYSAPPVRLKGRGLAGVAADASDAHLVPSLLAFFVMVDAGTATSSWKVGVAAAGLWSAGLGIRAILHHQVLDLANDEAASVGTFVARSGPAAAQRLGRAAFVIELLGLSGLVLALAGCEPWVLVPFALYLVIWSLDQRWEPRPLEPVPGPGNDWMPLVEFYQVWPAVVFAVALLLQDPAWWPVPVGLVVLFGGAVAKQGADLIRLIRSVGSDARSRLRLVDRLGVLGRALGSYAQRVGTATRNAVWWLRRKPIAWYRFKVYWPVRNWVMSFGHFRRRQTRRLSRRWRALRAKRS